MKSCEYNEVVIDLTHRVQYYQINTFSLLREVVINYTSCSLVDVKLLKITH